jgi:RNA polymerase sigma-70 factor, ECF subfamily
MAQATTEELELHNLIGAGDDLAFAKLCDFYLESTIKKVRQFNWQIYLSDRSLITEVVIDSFYGYLYNPGKFNPDKQTLERFLVTDSEGDLKNAWVKRKKRQQKFEGIKNEVEFEEQFGIRNLNTPSQIIIDEEADFVLNNELKKHFDSEKDIEIANLILSKERDTNVYAEVLKITHLRFEEQQKEVKRIKDRVKKVLVRKMKGKQF